MINKILIVGYGRAGKRHARTIRDFGMVPVVVDPVVSSEHEQYSDIESALSVQNYRAVVIASPPEFHLEQLWNISQTETPILCEKPLCGFEEPELNTLDSICDAPVMMALNYRWHPGLLFHALERPLRSKPHGESVVLHARQYRKDMPYWGLLLDHMPHSLDTISWMYGGIGGITSASHVATDESEKWTVEGYIAGEDDCTFRIIEDLSRVPCERDVTLTDSCGSVVIDADTRMFTNMWRDFLKGVYEPGLTQGITIQYLLNDIKWIEGKE
jgi:predicted dehydrogenase